MTSSLVGSEMCIRDRRNWALWVSTLCFAPAVVSSSGTTWSGTGWCSVRAVSYTHLTLPTICSV
eukprot:11197299-Prorocentrum_lima.AAC.1